MVTARYATVASTRTPYYVTQQYYHCKLYRVITIIERGRTRVLSLHACTALFIL